MFYLPAVKTNHDDAHAFERPLAPDAAFRLTETDKETGVIELSTASSDVEETDLGDFLMDAFTSNDDLSLDVDLDAFLGDMVGV